MTPDRLDQIQALYLEALDRPVEEQKGFLDEACADDTELRQEVLSLLEVDTASFMEESLADVRGMGNLEPDEPAMADRRIGPWRIVREIGRGGMGVVYLAERADGQFEQTVALKLVKRGMDSDAILARFLNERQVLATLQHPNIARLYDGGVTEEGQPYFAMEYVEGLPITDYCNEHHLSIDERLALFVKVCRAVEYAHNQLVIHRDLKPSNILVTENGEPHLLDFGLAKVLQDPSGDPATTQHGQRWMTLDYASPEQVKGEAVGTPSDTYQLGLVLYELLAGRRAYTVRGLSPTEAERVICEIDPPKPSTAAAGNDGVEAIPHEAQDRRSELPLPPEKLRKHLRGDLDTIILKALHKEPARGYASAETLANDIERHLDGLPVNARPDSLGYRARKFVSRHRWSVAVAAGVVVLVSSLVTFYTLRLQKERDQAHIEAAKAQAAQDYLVELFESADPAESRGEPITVQEVVQRGIARLDEDLEAQPEVHVEMLKVLGRVEQALGDFDLSTELLEQALAKTRTLRGEEHIDVAESAALLGEAVRWNGEWDRAETLLREALGIRRRLIEGDDAEIAINLDRLARTVEMQGGLEEAESLYREALAMRERLFGEDSDAVASNLNNLGWQLYQMGKMDTAEDALRRSLAIKEQLNIPSPHPATASTLSNLAVVLHMKGNYDEAEDYFVQALDQEKKLHGEDHPRYATALSNLAALYVDLARYEEAAGLFRRVLENDRRQLGPEHAYVGVSLGYLATTLAEDGRSMEAMPLLEEALEIFRHTVGNEHRYYARSLMSQGDALYYHGDPAHAVSVLERSVDTFRQAVGENHPDRARALAKLGRAQLATGQTSAAETALREALEIQRQALPSPHTETAWTLTLLGRALTELGHVDEAEPLLREAVEAATLALPPGHWRRIAARLELADCLRASGQSTAARGELEQALTVLQDRTDFHAVRLQSRARELQNRMTE